MVLEHRMGTEVKSRRDEIEIDISTLVDVLKSLRSRTIQNSEAAARVQAAEVEIAAAIEVSLAELGNDRPKG